MRFYYYFFLVFPLTSVKFQKFKYAVTTGSMTCIQQLKWIDWQLMKDDIRIFVWNMSFLVIGLMWNIFMISFLDSCAVAVRAHIAAFSSLFQMNTETSLLLTKSVKCLGFCDSCLFGNNSNVRRTIFFKIDIIYVTLKCRYIYTFFFCLRQSSVCFCTTFFFLFWIVLFFARDHVLLFYECRHQICYLSFEILVRLNIGA